MSFPLPLVASYGDEAMTIMRGGMKDDSSRLADDGRVRTRGEGGEGGRGVGARGARTKVRQKLLWMRM